MACSASHVLSWLHRPLFPSLPIPPKEEALCKEGLLRAHFWRCTHGMLVPKLGQHNKGERKFFFWVPKKHFRGLKLAILKHEGTNSLARGLFPSLPLLGLWYLLCHVLP